METTPPVTGDLGRLAAVEPQNTNILIIDDDPGLRELLECHQGEQITPCGQITNPYKDINILSAIDASPDPR